MASVTELVQKQSADRHQPRLHEVVAVLRGMDAAELGLVMAAAGAVLTNRGSETPAENFVHSVLCFYEARGSAGGVEEFLFCEMEEFLEFSRGEEEEAQIEGRIAKQGKAGLADIFRAVSGLSETLRAGICGAALALRRMDGYTTPAEDFVWAVLREYMLLGRAMEPGGLEDDWERFVFDWRNIRRVVKQYGPIFAEAASEDRPLANGKDSGREGSARRRVKGRAKR